MACEKGGGREKRGEKERGLQIYVASRKERVAALVGVALEVSVESTTWPVKKGKEERKCSWPAKKGEKERSVESTTWPVKKGEKEKRGRKRENASNVAF